MASLKIQILLSCVKHNILFTQCKKKIHIFALIFVISHIPVSTVQESSKQTILLLLYHT